MLLTYLQNNEDKFSGDYIALAGKLFNYYSFNIDIMLCIADYLYKFEEIIETAVRLKRSPSLLGSLHLAVARIYQPEAAHSMARRHLGSAIDYLGETPEIIELIVRYYEAKDKPIQTRMWQNKLKKFHD